MCVTNLALNLSLEHDTLENSKRAKNFHSTFFIDAVLSLILCTNTRKTGFLESFLEYSPFLSLSLFLHKVIKRKSRFGCHRARDGVREKEREGKNR